ncbi:protein TIFY 5A-like [Magnolia sinica]|uniref:protein TIFY 5A-like n=1 Tax=Magnolia sinica TaxID=86752 RepID=UPI00265AA26C|nr:protein TIFY 5A-like [Magnolia sinica]
MFPSLISAIGFFSNGPFSTSANLSVLLLHALKLERNKSPQLHYLPPSLLLHSKTILPFPMGRNCNLELRLLPAGTGAQLSSSPSSAASRSQEESIRNSHLTIFYNGRVSVCDVTELQAQAILCLARRETDQRLAGNGSEPCHEQPQPTAPALSMKKSLQRFLQKRKSRIRETSPYGQ